MSVHHILLTHSPVDGPSACIHLLPVVNNATLTRVHKRHCFLLERKEKNFFQKFSSLPAWQIFPHILLPEILSHVHA